MMFNKKKSSNYTKTININSLLKLSRIDIHLKFRPYISKNKFEAEVTYYQHPEADYDKRGTKHEVEISANTWTELRGKIDGILN